MASILQQIGTPLQLIALFLLLVAGVARVLVRSGKWNPSPAITRLVINRIFQAAIVALVIGIVGPAMSPALDRWLNSDETFHGAVLSTTGEAIAGASVNLITVATVSTNPLGQFEITVPRNRTLDEYKLQVSAPGYEISPVMTRSPAELKNAEIRLTPAADPELVKGIEPTVMVGQFLGYPFALVTLRVENDGDSLLSINQIQGRLSGNDTAFVLAPMSWTIAGIFGPFAPVTGPFPIFAGTKLDLRVVMMPGANLASLYNQLGALPEYANQAPCTPKFNGTVDPLTSEAF